MWFLLSCFLHKQVGICTNKIFSNKVVIYAGKETDRGPGVATGSNEFTREDREPVRR